jgi:hypothetical protein
MELNEDKKLVPVPGMAEPVYDEVKRTVRYTSPFPDLHRMRWINADPSIGYETIPTPEGQLVAAISIYAALGLKMRTFNGERSDLAFVQRLQDDLWGSLHKIPPKVYIVCRNESEARQPGLHPYDSPNLLWELKHIRRQELAARQLMTRNPTEKIVDKNNHAWDAFKYVNMQFPKAAEIPPAKKLEALVKNLNPMSAQIAAERFINRLKTGRGKISQYDLRNKKRMGR